LFGAVCPARGAGAALVLPHANADAMNLHLAEISRHVTPGAHAVVTLDGAGWHQTGGRLRLPENLSLLKLPPYSPELNPTENIWQFLRQNQLSNRVFNSYDDIVDALLQGLERSHRNPRSNTINRNSTVGISQCLMPLL
jgi:transposase